MRRPGENKAVAGAVATADKCPWCGRPEGHCRPVPLGYFCARDGLQEDVSRRIPTSPDPIAEAIRQDPAVLAARLEERLAQEEFDKRNAAWLQALSDLASARLQGSTAMFASGDGQPSRAKRDVRREERLVDAEQEAKADRERAGEDLNKARGRHRQAVLAARRALTI